MFFARKMGENDGRNITKNLSSKYSQKLLDRARKSATDAHKTSSKQATRKTAAATGNLIRIKFLMKLQDSQKLH